MCLKQNKLKSVKEILKKIRAEFNETDTKIIERINETKLAYGKNETSKLGQTNQRKKKRPKSVKLGRNSNSNRYHLNPEDH